MPGIVVFASLVHKFVPAGRLKIGWPSASGIVDSGGKGPRLAYRLPPGAWGWGPIRHLDTSKFAFAKTCWLLTFSPNAADQLHVPALDTRPNHLYYLASPSSHAQPHNLRCFSKRYIRIFIIHRH